MRVVDLAHSIREGMPVYPGTDGPVIAVANSHKEHGFRESRISFHSHTGTHIDPPVHIIEGAKTLDAFAAADFIGRGIVIDCREVGEGGEIGVDILACYSDKLDGCDFILFCTGWDKLWGTEAYFWKYPVLSRDALEYVISLGCKGIGFDTASLDPVSDANLTCHKLLFSSSDIINIENLRGLDELIGESFTLCCLPLKVECSDGAPARAVAIID